MELRKNEIPQSRMNKRELQLAETLQKIDRHLYLATDYIDGGYWIRRKDPAFYVSFTIVKVPKTVSSLWLKEWFRSHDDSNITGGLSFGDWTEKQSMKKIYKEKDDRLASLNAKMKDKLSVLGKTTFA